MLFVFFLIFKNYSCIIYPFPFLPLTLTLLPLLSLKFMISPVIDIYIIYITKYIIYEYIRIYVYVYIYTHVYSLIHKYNLLSL